MKYFFLLLLIISRFSYSEIIYINNHVSNIKIKSWKELRDYNIEKQDLDFSCGAASIATLINGYYKKSITERDVLKIMHKEDMMASFDDMQKALNKLGFQSKGYAISLETLIKLKIPVIAYIKHRNNDHFTVISGINKNFVRISDPSLGRKTLSIQQFKKMWETRADEKFKGKILVILSNGQLMDPTFFTKDVGQPTRQSIRQLASQF